MPKLRSYADGVSVSAFSGMVNFTAKLYPLKKSEARKAVAMVSICPDCDDPTKVEQFYTCETDHGPYKSGELSKAKEVNGELVRLSADEVADAKGTDLPAKDLRLSIHPRDAVEAQTFAQGTAYIADPNGPADIYPVLRLLAQEPDLALVGLMNLRGSEKLFRVSAWRDRLVLTELLRPEEINDFEPLSLKEPDTKAVQLASQLVELNKEDFDPDAVKNVFAERLQTIALAKAENPDAPIPPVSGKVSTKNVDLTSALEQMLQEAQAAKVT